MSYRDLFDALDERDFQYVVLRRYDELPEGAFNEESDVDLLLERSQFEPGKAVCESMGFSTEDPQDHTRLRLFRTAVRDPKRAIQAVADAPTMPLRRLITGGGGGSFENPRHRSELLFRDEQVLDLVDNLAYKSPMDGLFVPVHPTVTQGMLERRQRTRGFYTPAPADELAHLVPHCVFNKEGRFPPYYKDRCDTLLQRISDDDHQLELVAQLFEKIFFAAGDRVLTLVQEGRYSDIRSELQRFSNY